MNSDRTKYSKPQLKCLTEPGIFERDWAGAPIEELLRARNLIEQSRDLLSAEGSWPNLVTDLQLVLDLIDAELRQRRASERTVESGSKPPRTP